LCSLFRLFSLPPLLCLDSPTPELYTLSLHDALPISSCAGLCGGRTRSKSNGFPGERNRAVGDRPREATTASCLSPPPSSSSTLRDRKSTRLNSSHGSISYAVFCLKKKIIKTEIVLHH